MQADNPAPADQPSLVIPIAAATLPQLRGLGIAVEGDPGPGNVIEIIGGDPGTLDMQVIFPARAEVPVPYAENRLCIGRNAGTNLRVFVRGHRHRFRLGETRYGSVYTVFLYGDGAEVSIGDHCSANALNIVVHGPEAGLSIGEGCLFSFDTWLRTSDEHAIIDFGEAEPRQVNLPRPIVIGAHVWLGQEVLVTGGGSIGRGAIIGAKSVVSGEVPAFTLAAGVPARVLRTNVLWDRAAIADAARMRAAVRRVVAG